MWIRKLLICTTLPFLVGITSRASAEDEPRAKINTRIGTLEYDVGFPTKATAETLYNEMDFQRAVLAYQYADTLVSFYSADIAFKAVGADEGDLIVWQRFLNPKGIALTGNTTSIYGMSFLNLDNESPMVVEVPPGNVYGAFFDLWQVPIGAITERAAFLCWLSAISEEQFLQGRH